MFSVLSFNVFASLDDDAQVAVVHRSKLLSSRRLVSSRRLFLFFIAIAPYLVCLDGDFVFDDYKVIVYNKDIVNEANAPRGTPRPWLNFVVNDYWGTPMSSNASHKSWRPLTIMSFKMNYFWTRLNTRSYHLVNILLHGAVTVLSYEAYLRILQLKKSSTAMFASVIFAVHPVHSECVANISGRAELLSALFFLLSFLCYDSAISSGKRNFFTVEMFMCLLFAFTAMLSKEQAFDRTTVLIVDNPSANVSSRFFRVVNYLHLYSLNIWLLLGPASLCFDYSMGCIPVISEMWDLRMLYLVLFLATSCLAFLLTIPFVPASNVFFRVGFVLAERVLYIPSLGSSLCIVLSIKSFMNCFKRDVWWKLSIVIICVIYFAKSMHRSSQWRTEESLYSSGLTVCPGNAKIYYNLAKVSLDNGQRFKALENYRFALQLYPDYEQALNNLANLLKDEGELTEAEVLLERAVKIKSDFATAWMNLGTVKAALKKYKESEKCYLIALKFRPKYADCLYNLGNLVYGTVNIGRKAEALSCWSAVTNLRPDHSKAWTNIFVLLESEDRCAQGIFMAEKALRLVPLSLGHYDESESHFLAAINLDRFNAHYFANLGVLYHRWKKYKLAKEMYMKARQLNPNLSSHNCPLQTR
ncbi:unnamed protein product [Soboliphyme baturini]|uniref:dolichyl-phosphate-mannose--protein mannosyltransferase n=1 Tax=Soboliphyme baturini TaxID=241478 RepID=A0A183ILL4_9BILA|nr:unnamed protein product [Soboliphyme baturini]